MVHRAVAMTRGAAVLHVSNQDGQGLRVKGVTCHGAQKYELFVMCDHRSGLLSKSEHRCERLYIGPPTETRHCVYAVAAVTGA